MPSNERIALLAKQKAAKLDIEWIAPPISALGDRYVVQFKNGLRVYLSREEIDAVAQEQKQEGCPECGCSADFNKHRRCYECGSCEHSFHSEFTYPAKVSGTVAQEPKHEHDELACEKFAKRLCENAYNDGFEAGKASLPPFDVDTVAEHVKQKQLMKNGFADIREMVQDIAAHFAVPERKPITPEQIYDALYDELRTSPDICKRVADRIASLQTAPVEAERKPVTPEQAKTLRDALIKPMNNEYHMAKTVNEFFNLHPAPMGAGRCPDCDHTEIDPNSLICPHNLCICGHKLHRLRRTV